MHGALIDSELLAGVYLAMTGGQTALLLDEDDGTRHAGDSGAARMRCAPRGEGSNTGSYKLTVIRASDAEAAAHEAMLEKLRAKGDCVWDQMTSPE